MTKYMIYLSVVILTKNNEATIASSIQSVSFADEIVVIDDESCDATRDIAKQHNAIVYTKKLEDYSKQRNFALSKTNGKWVLFIDSDEVVSRNLAEEIQKVVYNSSND